MDKVFDEQKLEGLLVAHWTKFMDCKSVLDLLIQALRAGANQLAIINEGHITNQGTKLTVSRFCLTQAGFLIWFELSAPISQGYAEATLEARLERGNLSVTRVAGVLYAS